MAKTTKTQLVKSHLLERGKITSWEAIENYGATRLSAIIFNLRDRGMPIETKDIEFEDRYGNKSTYAQYVLNQTVNLNIK